MELYKMNKTTTDFEDSVMETTAGRRTAVLREHIAKSSVTKSGSSVGIVLNGQYLKSNDGTGKVVVHLDRGVFSRSLIVKKINRSLAGGDLENGANRSDVYSSD
jgi:hypothetical protein